MDIILMRFAEASLSTMQAEDLDAYEALLEQNDQDLYQWVTGQAPAPEALQRIVMRIVEDLPHVDR